MKLNVSFRFSENHVIPVGTLCQNGRDSAFEYTRSFLAEKLNPAPFRLPVREGVNIFDWSGGMETFGMFEDSLPDGWGRRLVDVMFRKGLAGLRRCWSVWRVSEVLEWGHWSMSRKTGWIGRAQNLIWRLSHRMPCLLMRGWRKMSCRRCEKRAEVPEAQGQRRSLALIRRQVRHAQNRKRCRMDLSTG